MNNNKKYLLNNKIFYLNEYLYWLLKEKTNINLIKDIMENKLYKKHSIHYYRKLKKDIARVKTLLNYRKNK